jgi:hypothetical protein
MACTGHCNQCAAHPGYIGPATPITWTDDPLVTGTKIKVEHWNELRDGIIDENTRRSLTWQDTGDPGAAIQNQTEVMAEKSTQIQDWRDLRNQISYQDTGSTTGWRPADVDNTVLAIGEKTLPASPQTMRDRLDIINQECICDCNYACTCNCNYPCTCNCAHSCLCDCNYGGK